MARVDAYANRMRKNMRDGRPRQQLQGRYMYISLTSPKRTGTSTHRDELSMRHGQHTFFAQLFLRAREPVRFHSQLSAADLGELLIRHWPLLILRKHNGIGVHLVHKGCHYNPHNDYRCSNERPHGAHKLPLISCCLSGYRRVHCRCRLGGGGWSTHTAGAVE